MNNSIKYESFRAALWNEFVNVHVQYIRVQALVTFLKECDCDLLLKV